MTKRTSELPIYAAAIAVLDAIDTGNLQKIQKAGELLADAVAKAGEAGRPAKCSDEEFNAMNHMQPGEVAKLLGVTPQAVRMRRMRMKGK